MQSALLRLGQLKGSGLVARPAAGACETARDIFKFINGYNEASPRRIEVKEASQLVHNAKDPTSVESYGKQSQCFSENNDQIRQVSVCKDSPKLTKF